MRWRWPVADKQVRLRSAGTTGRSRRSISAIELPEDWQSHQKFIERAEEDLLCAIHLCRRKVCGYEPSVVICYLLHQAVEKWLKLLVYVRGLPVGDVRNTHNLDLLLELLQDTDPRFEAIRANIGNADRDLLRRKFASNLRYEETPPDISLHIDTLLPVAFAVRRLAKEKLRAWEDL